MKKTLFLMPVCLLALMTGCNKGQDKKSEPASQPTSSQTTSSQQTSQESQTSEESQTSQESQPATGGTTITLTTTQDWAFHQEVPVFAHYYDGVSLADWAVVSFTPDQHSLSATWVLPEGATITGFLVVRCAAGTALEEGKYPNWQTKGDEAGRIYNKTDDVTYVEGTTSYEVTFKDYNPQ